MKNLQILMMCCFLVLLTACGREAARPKPLLLQRRSQRASRKCRMNRRGKPCRKIWNWDDSERCLLSDPDFF